MCTSKFQWDKYPFSNLTVGVYKSCMAKDQAAYDEAVNGVFDTLDKVRVTSPLFQGIISSGDNP